MHDLDFSKGLTSLPLAMTVYNDRTQKEGFHEIDSLVYWDKMIFQYKAKVTMAALHVQGA